MKEYSKGIYVKFKPEEVEILHDRMKKPRRYIIVEHPVRMQGRNFVPSIRLQRQQSFIR